MQLAAVLMPVEIVVASLVADFQEVALPFSRVFEVKWAAATDSQMALIVCLMVNFVAEHQDCLFVAEWSHVVLQLTLLGLDPFAFEQPYFVGLVALAAALS